MFGELGALMFCCCVSAKRVADLHCRAFVCNNPSCKQDKSVISVCLCLPPSAVIVAPGPFSSPALYRSQELRQLLFGDALGNEARGGGGGGYLGGYSVTGLVKRLTGH